MRRTGTILLAAALLAAACGDDGGTTQAASTAPPPTDGATTAAPSTAAPETTTTTEAPTTTSGAAGPLGVQWPPAGATAVYEGVTWEDETLDVEASLTPDTPWMGGPWTAVTFGDPEEGVALVLYMDFGLGTLTFKGMEAYGPTLPDGQVQTEWYEEPLVIDLFALLEGPIRHEAPFFLTFTGEDQYSDDMWVEVELVSTDETVETAYGPVDGCFHLHFTVGGPYIGGDVEFGFDAWLHPIHLLAGITEMPGFADLRLKDPWG